MRVELSNGEGNMRNSWRSLLAAAALVMGAPAAFAQGFGNGIPQGWTCLGNCGTSGADGVVTLAPSGGSAYGWVSSNEGVDNPSPFGFGSETNGSVLRSSAFTAAGGDPLNFKFNYVTSDGAGFADYAWARVLNASNLSQVALLFTARTLPTGSIIPGQNMPLPNATVPSTPIIAGAPQWTPLGSWSGLCFDEGCGYTGWVTATYAISDPGSYVLEFGVVNWDDQQYDSGLAFDGITVAGKPIDELPPIPEPHTYMLMLAGLVAVAGIARRRRPH
jgi:hypothetical protein